MQSLYGPKWNFLAPPLPKFMVELLFGKGMAKELFFASQTISNRKILDAGYKFFYPTLSSLVRPSKF
jgi:NAD dependent epimerase/dehydratase family enzyme